jgi:hypothetical protein
MFGRMLMSFPNVEDVAPQINALWRVLGIRRERQTRHHQELR